MTSSSPHWISDYNCFHQNLRVAVGRRDRISNLVNAIKPFIKTGLCSDPSAENSTQETAFGAVCNLELFQIRSSSPHGTKNI